jgi:hypothetical protein
MPRIRHNSPAFGHAAAQVGSAPFWATAAGSTDTSPLELSALGDHVGHCNGSRGRMFALRCAADAFAGFIAPRFVTTLVVVLIVFGVGSLIV